MVGSVDGGRVHYAFGYTGNGNEPASHLVGRALASLALDRRDEATQAADESTAAGWCGPEPLRYAGGTASARRCFAASASRRRAGGRAR